MSNFALVIQLNIPKDKFRIIIWSKFCMIGSFVSADPLVRHTLLKEFDSISIHPLSPLSYVPFVALCRICGDEKSLLVMTIWFFETVIILA